MKAAAERLIRKRMAIPLLECARLVRRADALLFAFLDGHASDRSTRKSAYVATILLSRVSADLRAAFLLARSGYTLQSWGVVASLFEHCVSLGPVLESAANAEKWIDHREMGHGPWSVRQALRVFLSNAGYPNAEPKYASIYQKLCAAKHANPLFQARYSVRPDARVVRVQFDPHVHPGIEKAARLGLIWGLLLVSGALLAFAAKFEHTPRLRRQLGAFVSDVAALVVSYERAVRKGAT
jgi:hypothetical protein